VAGGLRDLLALQGVIPVSKSADAGQIGDILAVQGVIPVSGTTVVSDSGFIAWTQLSGLWITGAPPVEDVGGGRRRRRGRRELFFEGFELHLDFDLDFERLLPQEMLDILGVPLLPPILPDAPALADIKEPIDREIAKLVRQKEVREHGQLQQKRLELLQMLDMELYFMVLALLEDDF